MRRSHFLHIRKTGGTAIKEALGGLAHEHGIILHEHATRLIDIPVGERVFFFLRDPIARFISGFNSRLRQGAPRYHHPWSAGEREAFARFPDAESLVLGITSSEAGARNAAKRAMGEIRHVNSRYRDWLGGPAYLSVRRADILFIGHQERLDADLARLLPMLGLPPGVRLPLDDTRAHRAPTGSSTALSQSSMNALRRIYQDDYDLLTCCSRLWVTP